MPRRRPLTHLSRRESQIMEIVYRRGRATVAEVRRDLPEPPGDTAVQTMLNNLEQKGYLKHTQEGIRYIYSATVPRARARKPALRQLLETFYEGSAASAMLALIDISAKDLSAEDVERIEGAIAAARKRGK